MKLHVRQVFMKCFEASLERQNMAFAAAWGCAGTGGALAAIGIIRLGGILDSALADGGGIEDQTDGGAIAYLLSSAWQFDTGRLSNRQRCRSGDSAAMTAPNMLLRHARVHPLHQVRARQVAVTSTEARDTK